jgi:hypothetical protein
VRSANGARALTLNAFGTSGSTRDGEAHLRVVDETNTDFSVSLTHDAGVVTTFDYDGRVDGGYGTHTVWNGSGTVTRDGLAAPNGTVSVTTTDEVVDGGICSGQPVSGNTMIENEVEETAIVTYDGAVDCDDEEAASYSLDGKPQGKLTGIVCSMGRPCGSGGALACLGVGLLLVLARARRRNA